MDDEDFLAAVEADNVGAPVEDTVEPPVQPEPTPETEPAATVEPAPVVEPQPAPEPPKQPDPGFVPIGVVLDTRDKLKAAEAELAKFRETQAQQPPVQMPDPYEQPEEFAAFQQQQVQQAILNTRLDLSEEMARQTHGDELVTQAQEWAKQQFQTNPAYQQEVLRQRNPYGYVIQQYKRQQALEKLGDTSEIDAFLAWKQAQSAVQQQQAAPAAPPHTASAIPPRSLASAPSAGGVLTDVVQSEEEIFDEVIGKRK